MSVPIRYLLGDATQPQGSGPKIIVHVCNDIGGWGRGFVTALSQRWKEPEKQYHAWFRGECEIPFALGEVQFVSVTDELLVANLIGQHDIKRKQTPDSKGPLPPIRYEAVQTGLGKVAAKAKELNASVHMPRIGCGLAGGTWDRIEAIVREELSDREVSVFVYDLPEI
jgi:O-acetyl-ADP-ribose deacetylase (regulator of RNase III)